MFKIYTGMTYAFIMIDPRLGWPLQDQREPVCHHLLRTTRGVHAHGIELEELHGILGPVVLLRDLRLELGRPRHTVQLRRERLTSRVVWCGYVPDWGRHSDEFHPWHLGGPSLACTRRT